MQRNLGYPQYSQTTRLSLDQLHKLFSQYFLDILPLILPLSLLRCQFFAVPCRYQILGPYLPGLFFHRCMESESPLTAFIRAHIAPWTIAPDRLLGCHQPRHRPLRHAYSAIIE